MKRQPLCSCTVGDRPCAMYPAGRAKGRTGRCEGCAMGIHKGHTVERVDPERAS